MKVYAVMACTLYDGDWLDSVYSNQSDAEKRMKQIEASEEDVDFAKVIEMEVK